MQASERVAAAFCPWKIVSSVLVAWNLHSSIFPAIRLPSLRMRLAPWVSMAHWWPTRMPRQAADASGNLESDLPTSLANANAVKGLQMLQATQWLGICLSTAGR